MRLRRLHIQRLPGIPAPGFTLEGLAPGINVISGPNASGKTSLLRAFRASLYRDQLRNQNVVVDAELETKEGTIKASRTANEITWQRGGQPIDPPPLPDERFLFCFTLSIEDLLEADGLTDRGIAERINRELAGGYDIRTARQEAGVPLKSTHGKAEAAELRGFDSALREVQRHHDALRHQETRLPELEREKEGAEAARRKEGACRYALALLDVRRQRLGLEAKIDLFPSEMNLLRGDETQRLESLREQRQQLDKTIELARASREQEEEKLRSSGLEASDTNEAAIGDRRAPLSRLRILENEIRATQEALRGADTARGRAIENLGGSAPEKAIALRPADIRTVEAALAESRALKAELRALDAELARLPTPGESGSDGERLSEARRELMRWLSAPRNPNWTAARGLAAALILAVGIFGIALGAMSIHPGVLALLVPLGLAAYFLLLRPSSSRHEQRQAVGRYRTTGVDEPASWTSEAVELRLRDIDRGLTDETLLNDQLARRRSVEIEKQGVEERNDRAVTSLRELAARINFDPAHLDASFDRWLRLVDDYERADGKCRAIENEVKAHEDEAGVLRNTLARFLSSYGEGPDSDAPDADLLGQRLDKFAARVRERDTAREKIRNLDRRLQELMDQIKGKDVEINKLFTDLALGPGNDFALRDRLTRLPEWQNLTQELFGVRGAEAVRQQALGAAEDLVTLVDADDETGIQSALTEYHSAADRSPAIVKEITEIETRIAEVKKQRNLETARARRQTAADALDIALEAAMFAEVGGLMLDQVETEHVQASRPTALRRADHWFARFTRHQFELEFLPGGPGSFAARETATGERRSLSELSSGTRMQLLLAVRIAFAQEAEQGHEPLPLFLDEALSTADPERFKAAAESLTRLADEEKRQIIYLTAQPGDIAFWQASGADPRFIDLVESRRGGNAIASVRAIKLTPTASDPPRPDKRSAEEYALALGVSPIAPWGSTAGIHLFHLVRDDLELLWRLLRGGVDRIGPLTSLLGTAEADLLLTPHDQQKLRRRIAGTDAWIEGWRYGRGRPIDRAALEESGVVSGAFIDRLAKHADELQGNGRQLIERLRRGKIDRFRSRNVDVLEQWLSDSGYIDMAQQLDAAVVERRTASAMAVRDGDAAGVQAEAQQLVRFLAAGVAAGFAPRGSNAKESEASEP